MILNNRKYNILFLVLLISILFNLVLMNRPFHTSSEDASLLQVPLLFWALILIISIQIVRIAIMENSAIVNIFLAMSYYLVFYIFNLFYMILPIQVDIGDTSFFLYLLNEYPNLDATYYYYFEFPFFFVLTKIYLVLFGVPPRQIINIGFFLLILSMPAILILIIQRYKKDEKLQFFLYPTTLLLMIYFFFNDQYVPQFLGLLFLFCVVGFYMKFLETRSLKMYYLTIFFYTLCVFTHPFIFIFFPFGIVFQKVFTKMTTPVSLIYKYMGKVEVYREKINEHDTIFVLIRNLVRHSIFNRQKFVLYARERLFHFKMKMLGREPMKDISLIVLGLIYLYGYIFHFTSMHTHFRTMLLPTDERGGSWVILSRLLGSGQKVGILTYDTYPLYDLVPEIYFLVLRYLLIFIMFTLMILMVAGFVKTSRKKIHAFDWNFTLGSMIFIVGGFLTPTILGGRSLQVTTLTLSKYFIEITRTTRWIKWVLMALLVVSPIVFTVNIFVNDSLNGNQHIEDIGTITSGIFVDKYSEDNETVITPDRVFYPVQKKNDYLEQNEDVNSVNLVTVYEIVTEDINVSRAELVLFSPKMENRLIFFGIDRDALQDDRITIYDQGGSKIYY